MNKEVKIYNQRSHINHLSHEELMRRFDFAQHNGCNSKKRTLRLLETRIQNFKINDELQSDITKYLDKLIILLNEGHDNTDECTATLKLLQGAICRLQNLESSVKYLTNAMDTLKTTTPQENKRKRVYTKVYSMLYSRKRHIEFRMSSLNANAATQHINPDGELQSDITKYLDKLIILANQGWCNIDECTATLKLVQGALRKLENLECSANFLNGAINNWCTAVASSNKQNPIYRRVYRTLNARKKTLQACPLPLSSNATKPGSVAPNAEQLTDSASEMEQKMVDLEFTNAMQYMYATQEPLPESQTMYNQKPVYYSEYYQPEYQSSYHEEATDSASEMEQKMVDLEFTNAMQYICATQEPLPESQTMYNQEPVYYSEYYQPEYQSSYHEEATHSASEMEQEVCDDTVDLEFKNAMQYICATQEPLPESQTMYNKEPAYYNEEGCYQPEYQSNVGYSYVESLQGIPSYASTSHFNNASYEYLPGVSETFVEALQAKSHAQGQALQEAQGQHFGDYFQL